MIKPHGGRLVDRIDSDLDPSDFDDIPEINLSHRTYQDVINVACGRFSPIEGFLTHSDFLKVVHDMTLEDGVVWPLPVVCDVDEEKAAELDPEGNALLVRPDGDPVGILTVHEVFKYNKEEAARNVFGTDDREHPGVAHFMNQDDFLVGGPITLFEYERYNDADLTPAETRVLFDRLGWETVAGFQTRNAPHRAHEYIQKSALEFTDGLLVQPKLGEKKEGDYRDQVIVDAYRELIDSYYPEDTLALTIFPSQMRYSGPREAVFDAIVRKNQGCTHFIVGRDHAGVSDYYDGLAAHRIFDRVANIGTQPLFFSYSFYCGACDGMASEKVCPHGDQHRVYPSGTEIRETFKSGNHPSEKVMRPEVAQKISDADSKFVEG